MRLKPKNTTLSPRGTLFKRFIEYDKSNSTYKYYESDIDNYRWIFDSEKQDFILLNDDITISTDNKITVIANSCFKFYKLYFTYNSATHEWSKLTEQPSDFILSNVFNTSIAKYQLNKYYNCGTFSMVIKGNKESTTTQFIKGNIMPLSSFTIMHFDDYINIKPDDLVIIEGSLYSVESVEKDHKHSPKDYNVYTAVVNSIL